MAFMWLIPVRRLASPVAKMVTSLGALLRSRLGARLAALLMASLGIAGAWAAVPPAATSTARAAVSTSAATQPAANQLVWNAIVAAAVQIGRGPALRGLGPGAIECPVHFSTSAPGLRVVAITADPLRGETDFRVVAANEPKLVPFLIALPARLATPGGPRRWSLSAPAAPAHSAASGALRPLARSSAIFLVRPDRPARLTIFGAGFRAALSVRPLELGSRGEVIRVRDLLTRRVLKGEVTGRDQLAARY